MFEDFAKVTRFSELFANLRKISVSVPANQTSEKQHKSDENIKSTIVC
jgi:hypothetical protein